MMKKMTVRKHIDAMQDASKRQRQEEHQRPQHTKQTSTSLPPTIYFSEILRYCGPWQTFAVSVCCLWCSSYPCPVKSGLRGRLAGLQGVRSSVGYT